MRYLTTLLAVIFISTSSFAQDLSLGLRGGVVINGAPYPLVNKKNMAAGRTGFQSGIKAAVDIRRFQFGAGVDHGNYKYQHEIRLESIGSKHIIIAASPLTNAYVFANYKIKLLHSFIYAGVQAGFAHMGDKKNIMLDTKWADSTRRVKGTAGNGISAGVQLGYTANLNKHWSLQAEAALRYINVNTTYTTYQWHLATSKYSMLSINTPVEQPYKLAAITIPVTIGINYSF